MRSQPPNSVVYAEAGREIRLVVDFLMTDQLALVTRRSDLERSRDQTERDARSETEITQILRRVQRALAWSGVALVVV